MVAASVSACSVALLLALALVSPAVSAQPTCTREQVDAYESVRFGAGAIPWKCSMQDFFNACDDDCLAAKQAIVSKAPDCKSEIFGIPLNSDPKKDVQKCELGRSTPADTYVPQFSTGLTNCSDAQEKEWKLNHSPTSPSGQCIGGLRDCSDNCLHAFEEAVTSSPVCADYSGYWSGEYNKLNLVLCLKSRGEKIADNLVLNTVLNGDGSKTVSKAWSGQTSSKNTTKQNATSAPSGNAASASSMPLVSALAGWTAVLVVLATAPYT